MAALLDTNALFSLAWPRIKFHEPVSRWLDFHAADGWATCILTELAFVRLSMNPLTNGGVACTADDALDMLGKLRAQNGHAYVAAMPNLNDPLVMSCLQRIQGYRQSTDAYLIGLAKTKGMTLVTFDQALKQLSPWPEMIVIPE